MGEHFFKFVEIKNFRGIKSLRIDDLARVNLLVGRNSCGKTSLLEALFLLTGMSYPEMVVHLGNLRGVGIRENSELKDLFYKQKHKEGIKLSGGQGGKVRELNYSPLYESLAGEQDHIENGYSDVVKRVAQTGSLSSETSQSLAGLEAKFTDNTASGREYVSKMKVYKKPSGVPECNSDLDKDYEETLTGQFLTNSRIPYYPALIDRMIKEKRKNIILRWLKTIEPRVQDISMSYGGIVSADIEGLDNLIPVNLLGDGLLRILHILSAIYGTEKGVLMIDEIENGLHVSSINHMWEMALEHSKQTDTQLFMTTHSKDVIEGLKTAFQKELFQKESDDVACFWLEKNEKTDEVKAYRYSSEQLEKALDAEIDIRH